MAKQEKGKVPVFMVQFLIIFLDYKNGIRIYYLLKNSTDHSDLRRRSRSYLHPRFQPVWDLRDRYSLKTVDFLKPHQVLGLFAIKYTVIGIFRWFGVNCAASEKPFTCPPESGKYPDPTSSSRFYECTDGYTHGRLGREDR
nr:hypothetical protein BaRGS_021344 [Batillaria attramentaria]